ncbi:MAG TPA: hypothetical protein VIR03_00250 [Candidatus Saccharimonadales bacterium]
MKPKLRLAPGQFAEATSKISTKTGLKISCKSLEERDGIYFLVDGSGIAWKPAGEGLRTVMGHITHDRDLVASALRLHVERLRR